LCFTTQDYDEKTKYNIKHYTEDNITQTTTLQRIQPYAKHNATQTINDRET